jgi:nucleotide-binding universal stress UspA family protein
MRILIPDIDPLNAQPAVRHVARGFLNGERYRVHLLYVRKSVDPEAGNRQLEPSRALLAKLHVPCTVQLCEAEDRVHGIWTTARRIGAERIVLGTARSWSLTRLRQDALIQELLETAPVPVSVVSGKSVAPLERYGVAAGLGATLALMLAG